MNRSICLYLHAHQPYRIKDYTVFDISCDHRYFNDQTIDVDTNNEFLINKIAEKSYLPTNEKLLALLHQHSAFRVSLSISGMLIEQFEQWRPDVLESFKSLTDTGRVEILGETYHHSLAFFYSRNEFVRQVKMHREKIEQIFGQTPRIFRNTELSYNNDLADWADQAGYNGIITEGWDPILGWRSPNFVYRPIHTENIRLLLKNYRLSDDIAFRFSNRNWSEWPLTVDKFIHWLDIIPEGEPLINLFMDYETFGEHQWEETGIFRFLQHLPAEFVKREGRDFLTLSDAIDRFDPVDTVDVEQTITWADTERDLTAWVGNKIQQEAIKAVYSLEEPIIQTEDPILLEDWRKLQTSDHFYYMCTKWFSDGDVHAYFNPYKTPYEAFINYMNVVHDLKARLAEKGLRV